LSSVFLTTATKKEKKSGGKNKDSSRVVFSNEERKHVYGFKGKKKPREGESESSGKRKEAVQGEIHQVTYGGGGVVRNC